MKNKNCVRALVLVAIVSWPAVETYRLCTYVKQAGAAQDSELRVAARLATLKQGTVQVAAAKNSPAKQ